MLTLGILKMVVSICIKFFLNMPVGEGLIWTLKMEMDWVRANRASTLSIINIYCHLFSCIKEKSSKDKL